MDLASSAHEPPPRHPPAGTRLADSGAARGQLVRAHSCLRVGPPSVPCPWSNLRVGNLRLIHSARAGYRRNAIANTPGRRASHRPGSLRPISEFDLKTNETVDWSRSSECLAGVSKGGAQGLVYVYFLDRSCPPCCLYTRNNNPVDATVSRICACSLLS